jgi:hypothetical protein
MTNVKIGQDTEWEKDAITPHLEKVNGGLSYSKMMAELEIKHPRTVKESADGPQRVPFKTCSTKTGFWMGCCKSCSESDINLELGSGVAIYFRQLKFLAIMFYIFTILNIPAYFLYINGAETGITMDSVTNIKSLFSATSLGNIGRSFSEPCTSNSPHSLVDDSDRNTAATFFCTYGKMTTLSLFVKANYHDNSCGP